MTFFRPSISFVDLAPENIYPSQLIELQAGYQYLTQNLGINPEKICLGGDSAGGNLVTSFLLHLVKPNPKLPRTGSTLAKPGVKARLIGLDSSLLMTDRFATL